MKNEYEKWEEEFLQIKWHSCYGDEIYYEIDLFEQSSIRFVHRKKHIAERQLSNFEKSVVLKIVKKSQIQIIFDVTKTSYIDPDIPTQISFRTRTRFVKMQWYSSDEINYPKQFEILNELTFAIEEMINFDKSDLYLPWFE